MPTSNLQRVMRRHLQWIEQHLDTDNHLATPARRAEVLRYLLEIQLREFEK